MTKITQKAILALFFVLIIAVIFDCYDKRFKIYYNFLGGHPAIVMYGSSLTQNGHWHKLLFRSDVVYSGPPNTTTAQALKVATEKVIALKPKICFIEGGINDLNHGIPVKDIEQNIFLLVNQLKRNAVLPVVELNAYTDADSTFNKRIDSLNQGLITVAHQTGIEFIDLNSVLSVNRFLQKQYAKKASLFTVDAYPRWATLVTQILQKHKID